jgi:probable HAF family extracellular repeat protein
VATSEAYSINNVGTAVGYGTIYEASGASKGNRAVRWNAAGVATELGHLGTSVSAVTNSAAWAINEAGAAVGFATKFDAGGLNDGQRAVRWNAGSTTAIELQVLGTGTNGSTFSKAYTLNENGTAVGWLDKYDGQGSGQGTRAVVWNPAGQVTELGLIAGASSSKAFGINNLGTAVGLVQAGESSSAAYWNANGSAVDLNTLIAPGSGWRLEQALAISDTGWVAGIGKFDDGPGGAPSPYDRVFMMQVPIEVALPGDYNVNGEVDAADYVIWRERMATLSTLPNDTTPGWVQPVDYSVWRANFSRAAGSGSAIGSTSVPEPASFACAAIGAAIIMLGRHPWRRIER